MPNPIKYSTTSTSGSYQKGNVAIGTNPVAYDSTWVNSPVIANGTFIVTEAGAVGVPKFYSPTTEDEWIRLAKQEGATGANTGSIGAVKSWFASQANYDVTNIDLPYGMPNIVGDGLVLNLDASIVESYPIDRPANQTNLLYTNGLYTPGNGVSGFGNLGLWVTESVIIPNSKFRISTGTVFRQPGSQTLRFYVPLNVLNDYQSYNLSFNYQIISGSLFNMTDWNDTPIFNSVGIDYETYKYSSSAGTGVWSGAGGVYTSAYRFMDFAFGTGSIVDIWDIQLTQNVSASSFNTGSGTTWNDISGLGSNGTLTNGPTFNANGNIIFDGTNDYISFSSDTTRTNLGISNYFTFDVWIKSNNGGDQFGFAGYAPYWGYTMRTNLVDSNTKLIAYLYYQDSNGTWVESYNGSSLNKGDIGQWVNFVITFDNGLVTHYVNGSKGTSTTLALTGQNPTQNLGYGLIGWTYFNGKLNQGKVYNRVLSQTEILQNYYQAPIVTDSLVFAVDAGNLISYENSSLTTYSLTGSYNGALTNGVSYTSDNGGSWVFDGTDDYIAWNDQTLNFIYTDSFSTEAWINWDGGSIPNNSGHIIGKTYNSYRTFLLIGNNGLGQISFRLDQNFQVTNTGHIIYPNNWYHIVSTWDSSTFTASVYVNGVLMNSTTNTGTDWTYAGNNFQIGRSPGENYFFNGLIPLGRAYNKTLSASEVSQNFNAQRSRFGV